MDLEKYSKAKEIENGIKVYQDMLEELNNMRPHLTYDDLLVTNLDANERMGNKVILNSKVTMELKLKVFEMIKNFANQKITELTQQFAEL